MPIDGGFILSVILLIVVVIVVLFVLVTLFRSIQIIKQGFSGVVERLGRFHKVLQPGLNFLVPFIDRVSYHVDMREQVRSFPPQPVITEDNLVVSIDTVVYFQVTDARAATYEIADYLSAVEQLTTTTLRNVVGGMNLEEALTSRDTINGQLRNVLDQATGKWGLRVGRVELKAIDPPHSIQDSMEKQMRAERDRRAAILTAEGSKQSQILEAEGLRQSEILRAEGQAKAQVLRAKGDAEAQVLLAKGESEAIERVFAAIHEGDADDKLLSYQYLQTLPKLAEGDANTLWVIPSQLTQALESVGRGFGAGRSSGDQDGSSSGAKDGSSPDDKDGSSDDTRKRKRSTYDDADESSILDETFQADSVSDVEVPSIAETLQSSGIDPQGAGELETVSGSTSLADETPSTDYQEAIQTARTATYDAPPIDPETLPDAPDAPDASDASDDGTAPRG